MSNCQEWRTSHTQQQTEILPFLVDSMSFSNIHLCRMWSDYMDFHEVSTQTRLRCSGIANPFLILDFQYNLAPPPEAGGLPRVEKSSARGETYNFFFPIGPLQFNSLFYGFFLKISRRAAGKKIKIKLWNLYKSFWLRCPPLAVTSQLGSLAGKGQLHRHRWRLW